MPWQVAGQSMLTHTLMWGKLRQMGGHARVTVTWGHILQGRPLKEVGFVLGLEKASEKWALLQSGDNFVTEAQG